jgi:hypothetical protein
MKLTKIGRRLTKDEKDSHSLNLADTVKMYPTPRAKEPGRTTVGYGRGLKELMEGKVQMYPTPTKGMWKQDVNDNGRYARSIKKKGHQVMLPAFVKLYPAPVASDYHQRRISKNWKGNDLVSKITKQVEEQGHQQPKAGGRLNPNFVEFLMGYPQNFTKIETTELKHSETQSFPKSPLKSEKQ